ncbi:unnamed protein product [Brassica rapa subsp. trilocularis]
MLVLPMDCSCTYFGQPMHHVSTHISTLAFSVNCLCTDLDMSSSFDGLDCPSQHGHQKGKTNLSHDGLNPTHVPYWWVNNPTLGEFCFTMIGRADIEESKSNVAMNAWLPQASFKFQRAKGSIGHAFTMYRPSQTPHLTMSSARIDPPKQVLGLKEGVVTPPPIHGMTRHFGYLKRVIVTPAVYPRLVEFLHFDIQSTRERSRKSRSQSVPGRHEAVCSRHVSSLSSPPRVDGFGTATLEPSPQSQSFSQSYGSILPTSLAHIVPSTRGCSPWRPDAVMSTTGRERHSVLHIFKGHRECTGHHVTCGAFPAAGPYLRLGRFQGGQAVKQKR